MFLKAIIYLWLQDSKQLHSTLTSYPAKAEWNSPLWYIIQYLLFLNSSLPWEWNKIMSGNVYSLSWIGIVPFTLSKQESKIVPKSILYSLTSPLTHLLWWDLEVMLVIIWGDRFIDSINCLQSHGLPNVSAKPNPRHDFFSFWFGCNLGNWKYIGTLNSTQEERERERDFLFLIRTLFLEGWL